MAAEKREFRSQFTFEIHVLMEREEELFTAHCLEFDIVAEGYTEEEANANIVKAIGNHIAFSIDSGNADKIMDPAPREYWNKFIQSKRLPVSPKYVEDYIDKPQSLVRGVNFGQSFACA